MKRILGMLPTFLVMLALAVLGLAVARPDLVPLFAMVRGDHKATETEAAPDEMGAAVGTVNDGWVQAHPPADGQMAHEQLPLIRLDSPDIAKRIGLQTARVETRTVVDHISANAESAFNSNSYAEILPRVRGLIREIQGEEGLACKPGTVLAVVDSAEVGSSKAEYLSARSSLELAEETHKRMTDLVARDAAPKKSEIESRVGLNRARADVLNAEQRLLNFGFTPDQISQIVKSGDISSLLPVISPIQGDVVARHAVMGEAVEPTTRLFVVANTDEMWVWIDIFESDFSRVEPGQKLTFELPGTRSLTYDGKVEWLDPAVNESTRTIRVRGVVDNPGHTLRANQFGRAIIEVGKPREAVLVPRDAVQRFEEGADVVFLVRSGEEYAPQRVSTAPSGIPGLLEVTWGLKGGEQIVTTGSFPLLSELRREEIVGE